MTIKQMLQMYVLSIPISTHSSLVCSHPQVLPHGLLMLFNVGDFVGLVPWVVTPFDVTESPRIARGSSPHFTVFQVGDIFRLSRCHGLVQFLFTYHRCDKKCIIRSWVANIWSAFSQSVESFDAAFQLKTFWKTVPSCLVKIDSFSPTCDNHITVGSSYIFHQHHRRLSHL